MFASLGLAQGTTSRITGSVTDTSGAPVAGASVTLKHEGTGSTLKSQTSDGGTYVFDLIQAGSYEITIEKAGFKKYVSAHNAAQVNQPTTVNASLQVGDVSAIVTVTNAAEQVQTSTSGNVGSTIDQKTLESLPIVGLRGRNPLDLLNFQPGVVVGSNTGGGVSVNGSRDRSFNFTLDGIDINESTAGGSNFTPLRPNPDSVQEFQIVTSNFTAELGRSSGASVTFVTRSGTNQFHGNLFEYYQTPRFNAKSYPLNIANLPKAQFVQHIYGGSLGGPLFNPGFGESKPFSLLKDKAFFFFNLQKLAAYDTALVTRTVYTASARAGLYRYVVGRANAPVGSSTPSVDATGAPVLPPCSATVTTLCIATYNIATAQNVATIDPALQAIINGMPQANNFTSGDGLNTAGFNWASPQHEKQYDFSSKFDFKINNKNSAYVRYAQGSQSSFGDSANAGRPVFPNSPNIVDTSRTPKNLAVNWRWSPTATVANEFLYGLSKYFFTFGTPNPDPFYAFTLLNPSTPNLNFSYNARGVRTNQFVDNLTLVHGSHTIKTGINFRYNQHKDDRSNVAGSAIEPIVSFSGTAGGDTGFNYPVTGNAGINSNDLTRLRNTIADLLGRVGSVSQAFVADPVNTSGFLPRGSRWINKANYKEYDYYGQDNWRVRQNFVLDLGMRWEVRASPEQIGRPLLVPNQPVKLGAAPSNSIKWVPGSLFKTAYNNIEPSIGFAWDPFKSGKTSIRGNYRLASDRFATFLFGSSIFQSTPGNNSGPTNSNFGAAGGLYRNIAPVIAGLLPTTTPDAARTPASFGTGSISVIDPDLRYPQIHEFSLSFQRDIGKGNVVEVTYIRKHAVHLLGGYNVNQANLFATVPGITDGANNFAAAFNLLRNNPTANSQLINLLMSGNAANNNGTARFRASATTALSASGAGSGAAGSAAIILSQKTCIAADVTAGICTAAQQAQNLRLLDINGFSSIIQPYSQFTGGLNVFDSSDYSNYNGLEFIFKRRISSGLGFQAAYTWSKSFDNRSWDPSLSTINTANSQAGSATPFDLRDRHLNYAYSDFDRRHVFQGTYTYELPFGADKAFHSGNKAVNYAISGWQFSGTTIWQSGRPFTVYSGSNTLSSVIQSPANCNGCTSNMGHVIVENGINYYFTAAQRAMFTVPDPGTIGNTTRNFFRNAPYFQTDLSVLRKFRFGERWAFDFRVDARNLTNHVNFDISASNSNMTVNNTAFGKIVDGVANSSRMIQFSGKLSF